MTASPAASRSPYSPLPTGHPALRPADRPAAFPPRGCPPRSRGRFWLRSADPADPPAIDPDYLSDADDLRVLREGVRLARRIAAEEPLASRRGREREPGQAIDSDDAMDDWIARRAQTNYHPVGTCRMGSDDESVVDPRLRVRGVRRPVGGRRVGDAADPLREHERRVPDDRRAGVQVAPRGPRISEARLRTASGAPALAGSLLHYSCRTLPALA
jgi:hypothetical protein